MRIVIAAVGKAKAGPEKDLVTRYLERASAIGRGIGLGPVALKEVDVKETGVRRVPQEAEGLRQHISPGAVILALDERGESLTTREFSRLLESWRDQGRPALTCLIGGADGLDPGLRAEAERCLAFGRATWPHMLARIMLTEQLYRAATVLAGHPYHREG